MTAWMFTALVYISMTLIGVQRSLKSNIPRLLKQHFNPGVMYD